MPGKGNLRAVEPHPAWVKFFSYAQSVKDGLISRLVIQDSIPIFMEQAVENINLSADDMKKWARMLERKPGHFNDYSPEWTKLVRIARDLAYCEFLDLKISDGVPVSIGKLVNKEKFA
ncbi:hypothetical protein MNBD_NITROSPINAE04-48 [hydrothermal vent metagenome]|uniref:Uncharacterized protein n=1 Tax=hydrothermal vent metagenome TaxID=652676 RepID=A0A3B1C1L4_9ZZZZ